ncbi:BRO family protein [Glutamicibacter arilaitensis]|uniref:BRO family protein n=1 Tax=Glutamicibacter arilaitensis TaxID=256701 RepID=UPI003A94C17B
MTETQSWTYQDEEVRTLLTAGEPCFIANDLCAVLDLANPRTTLALIDDDEKGVHTMDTLGGPQQMAYVTEAGMYSLVLRSRKPEAKAFKRWLTHEVLPSIRKTGQYQRSPMTHDEIVAQALQITSARVQALENKVAQDAPKVDYVDTFVADEDLITIRTLASDLKIGENELRAILLDRKWIYKQESSRWSETEQRKKPVYRYSAMADKKNYFHAVLAHDAPRFRGEVMHTLKLTPEGAVAVTRLISQMRRAATTLEEVKGPTA